MSSLFEMSISYRISQGIWHSDDDYEHKGWSTERTTGQVYIVAPSEALARAYLLEHKCADSEYKIDAVERKYLHAIISVGK